MADQSEARVALTFLLWQLRVSRRVSERRSLSARIRWHLRRLEGTPAYAEAQAAVRTALEDDRRCVCCGQILRRRSRLTR